jgi:hypothetical protein
MNLLDRRILCYALLYAAGRQTGAINDVVEKIESYIPTMSIINLEHFSRELTQLLDGRLTNRNALLSLLSKVNDQLNHLQNVTNLPLKN